MFYSYSKRTGPCTDIFDIWAGAEAIERAPPQLNPFRGRIIEDTHSALLEVKMNEFE